MHEKLAYAGPKPLCSKYGVLFDYTKEDRYTYLDTLIQLIEAIDKRKLHDGTLRFGIKKDALEEGMLLEKIRNVHPDIGEKMSDAAQETEKLITEMLERTKANDMMNPTEKEAWLKNIALMKEYVVQRSVNKAVYYALIDTLAEKLQEGRVRYIVFPMQRNFHHVAKSLGNALAKRKPPISSYAEILQTPQGLALKLNLTF